MNHTHDAGACFGATLGCKCSYDNLADVILSICPSDLAVESKDGRVHNFVGVLIEATLASGRGRSP